MSQVQPHTFLLLQILTGTKCSVLLLVAVTTEDTTVFQDQVLRMQ